MEAVSYEDAVRLAHEDFQRRLALVQDVAGRTKAFQRWMHSSFDLYGWFYLSLQFAHEGFAARKREALRHGMFMEHEYLDVLCGSNDTLRYGVDVPTFYGYIARACVREAVALFELFLFCLLEEAAGRSVDEVELRTPSWPQLCTRAQVELGIDLEDARLSALRDLRHRISHRLFGPAEDWHQPGLAFEEVIDALDLIEERVQQLDEAVTGGAGRLQRTVGRWLHKWSVVARTMRKRAQ